jgi:molybdate transport system ATP-binding protein
MTLAIDLRHPVGRIDLAVDVSLDDGLTALVGPSGAGKTTLLQIVAGLIRPQRGTIRWNDEMWVDTARGIFLPAHERRVGYVFQDARLFPHLSVRHNLTYGRLFVRRRPQPIAFDEVVALLGLEAILDRRPAKLSGGETQRVAIGRALLAQPRLLLLDEPLASVDVARREEVLPYLDRLRDRIGLPTIYVTHSIAEVATRASRIVRMDEGRVVAPAPA